jgi:hypothetical protein
VVLSLSGVSLQRARGQESKAGFSSLHRSSLHRFCTFTCPGREFRAV